MPILVIGIGNKYRSDDAVGLEIADSLSEYGLENCTIQRSSGEGIALINFWEDFDHVILIDAVKSDREAGTIHEIDLSEDNLQPDLFQTSSHLFALPEAVQLAKTLNKLPETMLVFGIEGKNFDYGTELSSEIQHAKEILTQRIKSEIESFV